LALPSPQARTIVDGLAVPNVEPHSLTSTPDAVDTEGAAVEVVVVGPADVPVRPADVPVGPAVRPEDVQEEHTNQTRQAAPASARWDRLGISPMMQAKAGQRAGICPND
jgi:hypothetical protein